MAIQQCLDQSDIGTQCNVPTQPGYAIYILPVSCQTLSGSLTRFRPGRSTTNTGDVMKQKYFVSLLGLLAMIAAGVPAAMAADANTGFYIGGGIGQADMKQGCEGVTISCDQKDTAWKLFAAYQFNRNFGVEGGYNDLGKTTVNGVISSVSISGSAKVKAWELVGIGTFPVADKFSLYGKLGMYRAKTDISVTGAVPGFSLTLTASDTNTDWTAGFGAMYDINRNVGIRAEWQRYSKVGGDNTGKSDVDVLGVGLLYRF